MFRKTLKKKQRLNVFRKWLGTIPPDKTCLLVTCGDNNGAMNVHLRRLGGTWHWADLDETSLSEMSALLGEEVRRARPDFIPYPDQSFDYVVSIDAHEHVVNPHLFTLELRRVARDEARILVTVPGGDPTKLVNVLKRALGMTKEQYGHIRDGFSPNGLKTLLEQAGIKPIKEHTFSKFFSELLELLINVIYVRVLARRKGRQIKAGMIAPQTKDQLRSVEKTYRIYSGIYPLFWLISQLDKLLFFTRGYVVVVEGRKQA